MMNTNMCVTLNDFSLLIHGFDWTTFSGKLLLLSSNVTSCGVLWNEPKYVTLLMDDRLDGVRDLIRFVIIFISWRLFERVLYGCSCNLEYKVASIFEITRTVEKIFLKLYLPILRIIDSFVHVRVFLLWTVWGNCAFSFSRSIKNHNFSSLQRLDVLIMRCHKSFVKYAMLRKN